MSNSKINAAILLLNSKAVETYGIIKEVTTKNSELGDAEQIAGLALQLVQYEGAMITLRQYSESLQLIQPEPEPPPEPAPEGKSIVVTSDRSPTFKNSQKKTYRKSKKKEAQGE